MVYDRAIAGTRPDPPTPTIRATLSGKTGSGTNWANVFWLHAAGASGAPTITQLQGLCDQFALIFKNYLLPEVHTSWVLNQAQAIAYSAPGVAVAAETPHSYAGTKTGTALTDQVAGVLSWQIAATWRGGKPRTYLGGCVLEELVDQAHWSPTAVSARHDAGLAFLNAMNGTFWPASSTALTMGTVSFFSGNAPRSPAIFYPYIGISVHTRIDTMRRRLGRET